MFEYYAAVNERTASGDEKWLSAEMSQTADPVCRDDDAWASNGG